MADLGEKKKYERTSFQFSFDLTFTFWQAIVRQVFTHSAILFTDPSVPKLNSGLSASLQHKLLSQQGLV